MLHKSHISNLQIYSDEWFQARIGKFTSSRIHTLCGEKEFTDGAMTYIYHKVGEKVSGHTTAEDEVIEDENTAWGNMYEPQAIQMFGQFMKIKFLAVQKFIHNPGSPFSSTPDAIWIRGISENQDEYNVRTVEVKCPRKFHKFIPFYVAKTPADIKKLSRVYYWQVLDQMDNCGSAVGYFVAYHPLFPANANLRVVEFNKMDLWDDFKLLQERKAGAVRKFNELLAHFSQPVASNS